MKKQQNAQSTGTAKNAKTNNSDSGTNKELKETRQIKGTPFTAIRLDETWFLTLGKYRLTEQVKTYKECENAAKDASWDRIMQIIKIMIIEHEQETKQIPQYKPEMKTE